VDKAAVSAGYDRFCEHNALLKALMTRWQLKPDGTPNDHTDAGYDSEVTSDLGALHMAARADVEALAAHSARLAPLYPRRLDEAWARVSAGDTAFVARPVADSYHTVWFELHEELIGLAGLTRAAEAAAGRAH
jgi:hypothetical protein